FSEDRLKNFCAILTDLDKAYITEENDTFANEAYIKAQMAAQESGESRKQELDEYTKENKYIQAFYAENTFETEVIDHDDNFEMFADIVDLEYKREADKKRVWANLSSDDKELRYDSVLKLAKKIGKGWLATELAQKSDNGVQIPT
ncbi:chromosome segregation protein SMC, partial [Vibrio parahaemolyticus]